MKAGFDATVLRQIESELRTIKAEYKGRVPEESIDLAADESIQRLADSRVPQFVPLFVGRFTRERLRKLVAAGSTSKREPVTTAFDPVFEAGKDRCNRLLLTVLGVAAAAPFFFPPWCRFWPQPAASSC